MALGPIYERTLEVMPWAPQSLACIREWKALAKRPLVAIGGITLERAPEVFAAGANSITVVSDVVFHAHPEQRSRDWLALSSCRGSPGRSWTTGLQKSPFRMGGRENASRDTEGKQSN